MEFFTVYEWLFLIGAYLVGSVPFGLLLTRMVGAPDIRKIGSGNIGATNVLRTGRKGVAVCTLLLDMGKGALAVWIAQQSFPDLAVWAGLAAMVGHIFPIWLLFAGGKGVATLFGVWVMLSPPIALAMMGSWLAMVFVFRVSALGALVTILLMPVFVEIWAPALPIIPVGMMLILVLMRHGKNIGLLMKHDR